MSIGDALAVSWMERGGITDIDFAINHPAGILGKKLTLKVSDLMVPITKIKPLNIKSTLLEILNIITLDGLGFAWVEDIKTKGKIIGIITDGDLRRTLRKYSLEKWENLKAMDFMTISPLTISLKTLATDALKKMESNPKKRISVLPVTEMEGNNEIVKGFINLHNIVETGIKSE